MLEILIFAGVMLTTTIFMMVGTLGACNLNGKRFLVKKVVDIIVVLLNYLALVALYNIVAKKSLPITEMDINICGILTIIFSFINLYTYATQLPMFRKYSIPTKTRGIMAMYISVIMGIFFSITEIYFAMYMINADWFLIDEGITASVIKTAFEFIYFTFSVTITYSGSGIELIGIIPKVFQMMHILFFYVFAADTILKLLRKEK